MKLMYGSLREPLSMMAFWSRRGSLRRMPIPWTLVATVAGTTARSVILM